MVWRKWTAGGTGTGLFFLLPAGGAVLSVVWSFLRFPDLRSTALLVDRRAGTGDLLHTALEFLETEKKSDFRLPLLRRASATAARLDNRDVFRFPYRILPLPVVALLTCLLSVLVPTIESAAVHLPREITVTRGFSPEQIRSFAADPLAEEQRTAGRPARSAETYLPPERAEGREKTESADKSEFPPSTESDASKADAGEGRNSGAAADGAGGSGKEEREAEDSVSVPRKSIRVGISGMKNGVRENGNRENKYSNFIFSSERDIDIMIRKSRIPVSYQEVVKRYFSRKP